MSETPERPIDPRPRAREYEDPHFHGEEMDPTQAGENAVPASRHRLKSKPARKISPPPTLSGLLTGTNEQAFTFFRGFDHDSTGRDADGAGAARR